MEESKHSFEEGSYVVLDLVPVVAIEPLAYESSVVFNWQDYHVVWVFTFRHALQNKGLHFDDSRGFHFEDPGAGRGEVGVDELINWLVVELVLAVADEERVYQIEVFLFEVLVPEQSAVVDVHEGFALLLDEVGLIDNSFVGELVLEVVLDEAGEDVLILQGQSDLHLSKSFAFPVLVKFFR